MSSIHTSLNTLKQKRLGLVVGVIGVVIVTGVVIQMVNAAGFFASSEVENATLTTNTQLLQDSTASGGKAIVFTAPVTPPPPPPPSDTRTCPAYPAVPDASCTGVPPGTVLGASGSITVNTAGTVIDAKDVTGTITVNANNVTIKRTRVTASAYAAIRVNDNVTGVKIEDVEVNGRGLSGADNSGGINGPATMTRVNVHDVENGIVPGSGSVITDSYIHDLKAPSSPHYDGIQIDGGLSNIIIRHNNIIAPVDQTSAVMIDNCFGPVSNITVDKNRLAGAGFTLYSDGSFGPGNPIDPNCDAGGTITGVNITNNQFGAYKYAPALVCRYPLASWTGNVNYLTGAVAPAPVLNQPSVNCPQ